MPIHLGTGDPRNHVLICLLYPWKIFIITEDDKIFVYGQHVDDFVFLQKDAIWTVATSALQEVDRQLQAEKARNDALEARILALEKN